VHLTEKYRPVGLGDLYGQDRVRDFFKSVIKHIDSSPRYFLVSGPYGTGKTALVRAFARDLLGSLDAPFYLEVDSGERSLQSDFERLKDLLFQEVGGFKVAVLDESHMISKNCQEQLLKIVEDYYGALIIFFCTTDAHLMLDTLKSRLHHFSLSLFSEEQLKDYSKIILGREGVSVSDRALGLAALNSQGHMRNMIKQLELIMFQGEDEYLASFSSVFKGIEDYFSNFNVGDAESVEVLAMHHPSELRSLVGYFFREEVINASGRFSGVLPRHLVPKCFANYLRLSGLAKDPDDYFSVLLVFRQSMRAVRLQAGGGSV
jgi:DNA polymerase III delta prime subunit